MDEATLIPDHNEAWSLACHRQTESNLARAYIDLRQKAKAVVDTYYVASGKMVIDGQDGYDPIRALRIISEAND